MFSLTPSQQQAFNKIQSFLQNGSDVFILKGYAGTGKTTLIKYVVENLRAQNKNCQILAPTGRAAKVLRDKMGAGITIHKGIYSRELECIEVESEDKSKKSFRYVFPLINHNNSNTEIVIVDESSMISDVEDIGEFYQFGSGRLLKDLLEYVNVCGIKKLIFVGDPAQLPPVTDNHSRALDRDYLEEKGLKVDTYELTKVIRQSEDSPILNESIKMRELLEMPKAQRSNFCINPVGDSIIEIPFEEVVKTYTNHSPVPEVDNCILISFSNRQCYELNMAIREVLFPGKLIVQIGDVLIINANNYSHGIDLFNGDMIKVLNVGGAETHTNIPVTINKEKRHIDITFRDVEIIYPNSNVVIKCKIIEDLLMCKERDLTVWQIRALYIDFCMRHPSLKEGSLEFKHALNKDQYFNALKVKFGYAITCHKSQGSEWNTVFVDYSGRCGLSDDHIRWCYTATTRAKNNLYIINPPHITSFWKLSFTPIGLISNSPKSFYADDSTVHSPYHDDSAPISLKLKCLALMDLLKSTSFHISKIQHFNYLEKYSFSSTDGAVQLDAWYDKNGVFKLMPVKDDGTPKDILSDLFNQAIVMPVCKYNPSNTQLSELYQKVLTVAADEDVYITNIIEDCSHYYVNYNFVTDARFAVIQFYYIGNGHFTTAMPKSELGDKDIKLQKLIKGLENVI